MTENEAIKILKRDLKIQQDNKTLIDGIEALQVAIKALEEKTMLNEIMHELSEYQAIGTVEDIQEVMALCKSLQETVCRYMNIGTIEEFKALKENESKCKDCAGCTNWLCDCANERAYAIDEFISELYKIGEHREFDWEDIYRLADRLKAGGENEID